MLKAIFAKHVKERDSILVSGGKRISVAWTDQRGATIRVGTGEEQMDFGEYDIVGLGHRPWPEGKTENDMLWQVWACSVAVALLVDAVGKGPALERALTNLHEASEAYELGKQPTK